MDRDNISWIATVPCPAYPADSGSDGIGIDPWTSRESQPGDTFLRYCYTTDCEMREAMAMLEVRYVAKMGLSVRVDKLGLMNYDSDGKSGGR